MYIDGPTLMRSLGRVFGGTTPDMRLPPDELQLVKDRIKQAKRGHAKPLLLWSLAGGLPILALTTASALWGGPSHNPLVDDRLKYALMGAFILGLGWSCFLAIVVHPVLTRRAMGEERLIYDAYIATTENWIPQRLWKVWTVLSALILLFGTLSWTLGTRIDDNGLDTFHWPIRTHHAYAQVKSVELYSSLIAPVGQRYVENVRVVFTDNSNFEQIDEDNRPGRAATIARYVSDHSGVPITTGAVRPN